MAVEFPPCPQSLKTLQHYLRAASEHDSRNPVVSYWCRLYALQQGLKIDRSSKEAMSLLAALMNWLEKQKKAMADNEAITNDIAAQAHIENYALKLFLWADAEDRAARFNKNVVKSFYTAGLLFDVMTTFGELTEEVAQHRKYAKWKAAYIHTCLKNGEVPVPGPMPTGEDDDNTFSSNDASGPSFHGSNDENTIGFTNPSMPTPHSPHQYPAVPPAPGGSNSFQPSTPLDPSARGNNHPPTQPAATFYEDPCPAPSGTGSGVVLNPEQIAKAQKYCKWAASALNYDDISTAIMNLKKGIHLLETGQDD